MKLILIGAPGAGKSTLAKEICRHYQLPVISTGDMLRHAIREKTPVGVEAERFVSRGELVPDEIMIRVVDERLRQDDCRQGFLLDGFPRTLAQARNLESLDVRLDGVVHVDVPDSEIETRLTQRRICQSCDTPYHLTNDPPNPDGTCRRCGAPCYIREDDKPEVIRRRLETYHRQTDPVVEFYRGKGLLRTVAGEATPAETAAAVIDVLNALKNV